jgi:glycosyltransferase involved in cell wall biosynthesis
MRWFVNRAAIFAIARFDEVIACTQAQADFVKTNANIPATVVRNGISRRNFEDVSSLPEPPRDTTVRTVTYVGTLGHSQNILTLAQAAEQLRDETGIRIVIVGAGPGFDIVTQFIREKGLTNIELTGKLPWPATLKRYEAADILYAQLKAGSGLDSAEPTKLFEYFATGRPVIYGGRGVGRVLASQFENAFLVESDDVAGLCSAIRQAVSRPMALSQSNRKIVGENYLREEIFSAYLRTAGLDR